MPEENYLAILEQSLKKKLEILNQIRVKNELQRVLFLNENLEPQELEKNLDTKAALVEELDLLDQGFEDVYARIRDLLQVNKEQYNDQIVRLQHLIRQITAESNSIQAEEQRNYKLAEKKFASIKKQVREVKASHKVVSQYYRNMNNTNYIDAQFMDNKKVKEKLCFAIKYLKMHPIYNISKQDNNCYLTANVRVERTATWAEV